MKPLFSIVVPSLDQGTFLERALVSLFSQKGADTEVIVVDGGSTDGSVGILERFAAAYGGVRFGADFFPDEVCASPDSIEDGALRFLWCSEPDNGQSHALNKGFALAQGQWLGWLNADDLLLPGVLDAVRAYLSEGRPPAQWIVGNLVYIDRDDRILRCACGGCWRDFLYRNAPVRVYGPGAFFLSDLFRSSGGFDESLRYAMDTDLWLRFRNLGARFLRFDRYFWGFRTHGGSKTNGGERDKAVEKRSECDRVYEQNGLSVRPGALALQRFWRLFNGCYLVSFLDTCLYRGRKVSKIEIGLFSDT